MRKSCHLLLAQGRNGLSIFEVLAVVGIMSILTALLLPAVQHSRDAARKVQCRNQLRQIALAFQNYESVYSVFPVIHFTRQIRPFIEVPQDLRKVPMYACPSDLENATGESGRGKISYAVNAGLDSFQQNEFGAVSKPARYCRPSDFVDGLSNTALVAEKLSFPWFAPKSVNWDDAPQHLRRTFLYFRGVATGPDDFFRRCNSDTLPLGTWYVNHHYNHLMPPNSRSCVSVGDGEGIGGGQYSEARMAGSVHAGGTHVANADGSASFVSSSIDLIVWRATGTRSGGESF